MGTITRRACELREREIEGRVLHALISETEVTEEFVEEVLRRVSRGDSPQEAMRECFHLLKKQVRLASR